MEERFRFTGENPPLFLWSRYPNWQNAYEEEGHPGQDETTLRPADNQQWIDDCVSFTVGDARLADGRTMPAFLSVLCGEVDSIHVYPNPDRDLCWILHYHQPTSRWVPDSLSSGDGVLSVPLDEPGVFPLRVSTRLPLEETGEPITLTVETTE